MPNPTKQSGNKITKEERRAKYTKIARDRKYKERTRLKESQTICFHCRKHGHSLAQCPDKPQSVQLCFKCGSTEHGLWQCPKLKDRNDADLPFAKCFVCQKQGHLSRQCPQNTKGIYVNGGSCRLCGSTEHRATECPDNDKKKKKKRSESVDEVEVEDLLEQSNELVKSDKTEKKADNANKKRRVVKF